eukprot:5124980-Alexandrium_andersonii.AAC.1
MLRCDVVACLTVALATNCPRAADDLDSKGPMPLPLPRPMRVERALITCAHVCGSTRARTWPRQHAWMPVGHARPCKAAPRHWCKLRLQQGHTGRGNQNPI